MLETAQNFIISFINSTEKILDGGNVERPWIIFQGKTKIFYNVIDSCTHKEFPHESDMNTGGFH